MRTRTRLLHIFTLAISFNSNFFDDKNKLFPKIRVDDVELKSVKKSPTQPQLSSASSNVGLVKIAILNIFHAISASSDVADTTVRLQVETSSRPAQVNYEGWHASRSYK